MEQIVSTAAYPVIAAVTATAATTLTYHSTEKPEQDLRALAKGAPEIAELRPIGKSAEERPIWAPRIGVGAAATAGCSSWAVTRSGSGLSSKCPTC